MVGNKFLESEPVFVRAVIFTGVSVDIVGPPMVLLCIILVALGELRESVLCPESNVVEISTLGLAFGKEEVVRPVLLKWSSVDVVALSEVLTMRSGNRLLNKLLSFVAANP